MWKFVIAIVWKLSIAEVNKVVITCNWLRLFKLKGFQPTDFLNLITFPRHVLIFTNVFNAHNCYLKNTGMRIMALHPMNVKMSLKSA